MIRRDFLKGLLSGLAAAFLPVGKLKIPKVAKEKASTREADEGTEEQEQLRYVYDPYPSDLWLWNDEGFFFSDDNACSFTHFDETNVPDKIKRLKWLSDNGGHSVPVDDYAKAVLAPHLYRQWKEENG